MTRPTGLGRGLSALIPTEPVQPSGEATFQQVPIDAVRANPYQPRTAFDDQALADLAHSIGEVGVLQPLLVRRDGRGFELIAGERRLRAAQMAGLDRVPVVLREADNRGSLEQAIVENLHRQDLNPLEEAAAYQQLHDDFDMTQADIARRVGRSRSAVANSMRLVGLPTAVQRLLRDGLISAGHGRALLALDGADDQARLAERIVREDLTVRQTEEAVRRHAEPPSVEPSSAEPASTRDAAILELEQLLSDRLSTSVHVTMSGARSRGRIIVDYADLDDLERIYRLICDDG